MRLEDRAGFWPLVFVGYFLFQAVWRRATGGALGLDEAQIILDGQGLAWGYGAQPPLYGWLQWGFLRLMPDPILAMALLKNALLASTFLLVYRLLRSAHPPRVAGLAAASMMLLPQIAWESQRALTHSVLCTTLAAAAALVFWTRVLPGRPGADLLFGLAVGLGMLAKANFVFVPVALVLAAASLPELRRGLRPAGMAVAGRWRRRSASGRRSGRSGTPSRLRLDLQAPAGSGALGGGGRRARAAGAGGRGRRVPGVAGGGAGDFALALRPAGGAGGGAVLERFLLRTVVVGLVLAAAAVLVTGSTTTKDRWLQPVLYLAAPVATLWLLPRMREAGGRWLGRAVAALAVLAAAALPVALVTGTPGEVARGGAPVAGSRRASRSGPEPGRIVVDPEWLAGNFHYLHPEWPVERAQDAVLAPGETALLVVRTGGDGGRGRGRDRRAVGAGAGAGGGGAGVGALSVAAGGEPRPARGAARGGSVGGVRAGAGRLEQEPDAALGLVDPDLEQAGGRHVAVLVAGGVQAAHARRQLRGCRRRARPACPAGRRSRRRCRRCAACRAMSPIECSVMPPSLRARSAIGSVIAKICVACSSRAGGSRGSAGPTCASGSSWS